MSARRGGIQKITDAEILRLVERYQPVTATELAAHVTAIGVSALALRLRALAARGACVVERRTESVGVRHTVCRVLRYARTAAALALADDDDRCEWTPQPWVHPIRARALGHRP